MGIYFTDQFSLLHFATGVIAYFWGISFLKWFIIHLFYEVFTNTKWGINFINKFSFFPCGKMDYDTLINSLGDQFWSLVGWIFTFYFIKFFYKNSNLDEYI